MKSEFDLDKAIDETVAGIASLFTRITYVDCFWPNPSNKGYSIFLEDYINTLLRCVEILDAKGKSDEELAMLFGSATNVFRVFVRIGRTKKILDKKKRMYLAEKLLKCAFFLREDEPFSAEKNVVYSPKKVEDILDRTTFIDVVDTHQLNLFKKLNFLLYNFCETFYWTRWTTGCDFHGPYKVDCRKKMVVKNFFDLKPVMLWGETKEFEIKNARIDVVYKDVDWIKIDQYGHITSSNSLADNIDSFYFGLRTESGKVINDWCGLENILPSIESNIVLLTKKINSMNIKQIVAKQAEIEWYMLKNVLMACDLPPYPTKEVYNKINSAKIKEAPILKSAKQSEKERYNYYLKLLDPRID